MKIVFDYKLLKNSQFGSFLLTFLVYLGVFQCLFLILPFNWFDLLNYRFVFTDYGLSGLFLIFLLLPSIFIIVLNKVIDKYLFKERTNWQELCSKKVQLTIISLGLTLIGVLFGQFLYNFWYFRGNSVFGLILANLSQYLSISIAILMGKKMKLPKSNNKWALFAALFLLGLAYLFGYNNIQTIFVGSAIIVAIFLLGYNLLTETRPYIQPNQTEEAQIHNLEQIGWANRTINHKTTTRTFGWLLSFLTIILLSSFIGTLFAKTSSTGSSNSGYLILIYMICVASGYLLSETKLPWKKGTLRVGLIFGIIVVNLLMQEVVPVLKHSIFEMILTGFAMGLLLSLRIRFRISFANDAFGELTFFYGIPWSIFWATFLGLGSTLMISLEENIQNINLNWILNGIFVIFSLGIIIFEAIRYKLFFQEKGTKKPRKLKIETKELSNINPTQKVFENKHLIESDDPELFKKQLQETHNESYIEIDPDSITTWKDNQIDENLETIDHATSEETEFKTPKIKVAQNLKIKIPSNIESDENSIESNEE